MMTRMLAAVAAMSLLAAPALAHAFLSHADPGAGAILAQPPKVIVLDFSEKLESTFSGVGVSDAAGHDVEAAAPAVSGTSITVALKPLAAGDYRVNWHAVSVDSHRTEGSYRFTIKP